MKPQFALRVFVATSAAILLGVAAYSERKIQPRDEKIVYGAEQIKNTKILLEFQIPRDF